MNISIKINGFEIDTDTYKIKEYKIQDQKNPSIRDIIQKTLNTYKSTILAFPRAMQITFLLQCSHYRDSTVMIKMVPESVKEGNRRLNCVKISKKRLSQYIHG